MKAIAPLTEERFFTAFLDAVDGTVCVPANTTGAALQARVAPHGLRFPLLLDPATSLSAHVAATTHAPASCRFGQYCDNILGMNWRLPGGRVVRIGERVAKTTTGYDWLRFLLHAGGRLGEPVDYVLRLRPACGFSLLAWFEGEAAALRGCVSRLLHGGWMHWWDAVDFVAEGDRRRVRVAVDCPPGEAPLFTEELQRVAAAAGARLTLQPATGGTLDGIPDLVLKTTPDRVIALAEALAQPAARCVGLGYSGVVHVYLREGGDRPDRIRAMVESHEEALYALGGDWHSRWLPAPAPASAEAAWLVTLEQALRTP